MIRQTSWVARTALLAALALLPLASASANAYLGGRQTVYAGETLAAKEARVDTVVVTRSPDDRTRARPPQVVWTLAGTSSAADDDSVFFACVKAIVGGAVCQIGQDSLVLRPGPAVADAERGSLHLMHTVADSFQIRTANPLNASVTGLRLEWYGRVERDR